MLMGRLFQSRGAAIMKDRSPMVAFVKRFGVLKRIPLLQVLKPKVCLHSYYRGIFVYNICLISISNSIQFLMELQINEF